MKIQPTYYLKVSFFLLFFILLFSSSSQARVLYGISVAGNRDFPGGNYAEFMTNHLDECVRTCADAHRCVAFAYEQYSRTCWLKDRIYDEVYVRGVKSGRKLPAHSPAPPPPPFPLPPPPPPPPQPMPPPHQPGIEIMFDTDLPGSDYRRFQSLSAEICSQACMEDHRCRAFTYNRANQLCWLKSRHPRARQRRGAVSGLKY